MELSVAQEFAAPGSTAPVGGRGAVSGAVWLPAVAVGGAVAGGLPAVPLVLLRHAGRVVGRHLLQQCLLRGALHTVHRTVGHLGACHLVLRRTRKNPAERWLRGGGRRLGWVAGWGGAPSRFACGQNFSLNCNMSAGHSSSVCRRGIPPATYSSQNVKAHGDVPQDTEAQEMGTVEMGTVPVDYSSQLLGKAATLPGSFRPHAPAYQTLDLHFPCKKY